MSSLNGGGESNFANIGGEDENFEAGNLTVNGNLTIVPIGIDNTEFSALSGISSNIQVQLDDLQAQISTTGATGYYGYFYDNSNNTVAAAANTDIQVPIGNIAQVNGMTLASNEITVVNTATYNLSTLIIVGQTTAVNSIVYTWIKVNGTAVPHSMTQAQLAGSSAVKQSVNNAIILTLTAGDKITVWWKQTQTAYIRLPTSGTTPNTPSIKVEVVQITNQGAQGVQGIQGIQGLTGPQGIQGTAGSNGTNGTNGATGQTGPQGATGPKGDKGDPGEVNLAEMTAAIAVSAATTLAGANAYTDVAVGTASSAFTTALGATNGRVFVVEEKTQNQEAVPEITTFVGSVESASMQTDAMTVVATLSGTASTNLQTAAGTHVLKAPSIIMASTTGIGGGIELGAVGDFVYVNGRIFQSYFVQWSLPPP